MILNAFSVFEICQLFSLATILSDTNVFTELVYVSILYNQSTIPHPVQSKIGYLLVRHT